MIVPAVEAVLAKRLLPSSPRPIAIALSGGGDSAALLLAVRAWAARQGRPLIALTVDHQLQPASRAWTQACAELAARVGVGFRALAWEGRKPSSGLPAAARAARHRLLADAAREAGARVLLIGHTRDDVLEARAMRAAGATTPEPREWSPSPAWPEGRGLFLLRPLLGLRRAELRAWLASLGETWIDDPANTDPRFARARARTALGGGEGCDDVTPEAPLSLAQACETLPGGGFAIPRERLRAAALAEVDRLVALACVCAGGGARLPAGASVARLGARLRATGPVAETLAGARIVAGESVLIVREAGEASRGGLVPLRLTGTMGVWDGRFEVAGGHAGLQVRALRGMARRLPEDQRRALASLPAEVRPALPAVVDASGAVTCPVLAPGRVEVRALTAERLLAAAGLIDREPA